MKCFIDNRLTIKFLVLLLLSTVLVHCDSQSENKKADKGQVKRDTLAVEQSVAKSDTVTQSEHGASEQTEVNSVSEASSQSAPDTGEYIANIVPEGMTVEEKKKRFRALLVPPTLKVHKELQEQFERVSGWLANGENAEKIAALKTEYRAENDQELLAALKPHPPSIVLAQAAMESAWGTSRFFVKAYNVFGVWSFDSNEPRIAAGEQRGEKTIWLKKYPDVEASVRDNYRVLARSAAFKEFRELRMASTNPYELVKKLDKYSEKGHEYGEELASMISFNKFSEYDPVYHEKP